MIHLALASKESLVALATTSPSKSVFPHQHVVKIGANSCSLWNVEAAINSINETYEIDTTLEAWNYRSHILLTEFEDQIRKFECSGGVWTQTTDVEGEVNGLMTYDRRVKRVSEQQWKDDIQALYEAASERGGYSKRKL
jgi:hypothetical protein